MAEVASGLLTSAVVKIAVNKLSSAFGDQATLLWSFKDDLNDMKNTLEYMKAVFVDAEKKSIKDEVVRLLMKQLKAAALDIVDMMDEYQDERVKKSRMLSCFPIACKKIALANKMKDMRENLKKINEKWCSFNFTRCFDAIPEQPHNDKRETTSDFNEAEIIGRDIEKKAIIDLLTARESKKETVIVPIYGLGAMGKSTLARLVYNDTEFKKYDHQAWVYVSQVFNLREIGRSIISQLVDGQQNGDNLELINRHLDDLFCGKKVLIVLDDIWEESRTELDKLKTMLHVGKTGCMIDVIVTTRKEDIAKRICTNNESYRLQPLNDDICWDIIKRASAFERKANKEQLEQIGLDIAKKCGGVPLAAQALGYMLKYKDLVDDWSNMEKSDIWNDSAADNENERVLPSLMLSYERMAPNLRLLFSYCAIFPKGHNIVEDDLIHQWSALDFIEPSEGNEYIEQLLGMSFLQKSTPWMYGDEVVRYTMHDLVHDLARSVIGDELALFENAKKDNTREYCRYALLTDYDGKTKLSDMLPNKVRAFHFVGSSKLDLLPPGAFAFAKRLRILDFSGCSSILLPASVGQLKQLRCLIAPETKDGLPECITELSKLQYLNLNGYYRIFKLPESFGKLGFLIYLGLSGCSMSNLPESLGCLRKLMHLYISRSMIRKLPSSIGNLTELRHLKLSDSPLEEIPESLCNLTKLQYLNLSNTATKRLPEDIGSLVNLRYFNMSRCQGINELPESFPKLRNLLHLDLHWCKIQNGLPGALRGLTTLRHLKMALINGDDVPDDVMRKLTNLTYLNLAGSLPALFSDGCIDFIGTLTSLEHLDLSYNGNLMYLPESIGNLQRLHTLNLSYCTKLKSLPGNISALNLKSLLIQGCSDELTDDACSLFHVSLTLPFFKVRADDVSASSNLHQLKDVHASWLQIRSLENVKSLEEAQNIMLMDKQTLSDLTLAWTLDTGRVLEDEDLLGALVPPCGLEWLRIQGYSSRIFPSWLGISDNLPNLVRIELRNLPTCSSLPPLGKLPNLGRLTLDGMNSITKMDKEFCGGTGAFRGLCTFIMRRMTGLEEWTTTYSGEYGVEEFMFPKLSSLFIEDCPKLRLKPCAPTFDSIYVKMSNQVISSLGEMDNGSHLSSSTRRTSLYVGFYDCQSLKLLQRFPALQILEVDTCPNLTTFPVTVRQLTSLRVLTLRGCDSISLPEWLGELSSLERINIEGCKSIKSFPPCIQQLTKLHYLRIWGNQELKQWCESEENKVKLAHIEEIDLF